MPCSHQPPCSTLHLYHWGTHFIAARDKVEAEEVGVDEDGCQCNEDDVVEEIELTPEQWICRQREGDETGFIVGEEW